MKIDANAAIECLVREIEKQEDFDKLQDYGLLMALRSGALSFIERSDDRTRQLTRIADSLEKLAEMEEEDRAHGH